jgi:hypothetical protein
VIWIVNQIKPLRFWRTEWGQWISSTIISTIDGIRVLSVIHSELSRIASVLFVIYPPLQVAIVCLSTSVCRVAQILGVMCSLQTQNWSKNGELPSSGLMKSQETSGHQESTTSFVHPTSERVTIRKRYQVRWLFRLPCIQVNYYSNKSASYLNETKNVWLSSILADISV